MQHSLLPITSDNDVQLVDQYCVNDNKAYRGKILPVNERSGVHALGHWDKVRLKPVLPDMVKDVCMHVQVQ